MAVLGEHAFDGGPIEHRFIGARLQHRWKIEYGGGNGTGAREQGGALEHVAKLADISWPGMIEQRAFGITREARTDGKESACQWQHVVAPLGEWRQCEFDDAQAVIKIFAKPPFTHGVAQRHVGGGDDAHVGAPRGVAAEAFVFAGLQHAQ